MTDAQVNAADARVRARAAHGHGSEPPKAAGDKIPGVSRMVACDESTCGGGGGGGSGDLLPPRPAGIYAENMNVRDAHEPWTRGEPELEIDMYGTQNGIWYPFNFGGNGTPQGSIAEYDPNIHGLVWMDCAGEHAADSRFFDFNDNGTQSRPYPILFADQQNFGYREIVSSTQGVIIHDRIADLTPLFLIRIMERDDGGACPEPPQKFDPTFGVQLVYSPRGWEGVRPYTTSSFKEIVNWLFGNNNDLVSQWTISSFDALEQASHTPLNGGDADLTISSYGFSRYNIPPEVTYYP